MELCRGKASYAEGYLKEDTQEVFWLACRGIIQHGRGVLRREI
jgi:hypothetical protein